MIIIFGTRGSTLTPIETGHTCTACQNPSIFLVPYQRYFHIFWIPIFPTSREYQLVCSNCNAVYNQRSCDISPEIKEKVKTPKWTFAGLIVIAAFILFAFISGTLSSANNNSTIEKYLSNPSVGDIYEVKYSAKEYGLLKVGETTQDSIYFYHNEYATTRQSDLADLKKKHSDSYAEEDGLYGYSRKELTDKKTNFTILKIIR